MIYIHLIIKIIQIHKVSIVIKFLSNKAKIYLMKAGRFIHMLPVVLVGTTLFYFSTCPLGDIGIGNFGSFNVGSSDLHKPSWALNRPGNVYLYIQAPPSLNYSESSGLNYKLPLIYINDIYTMSNSQLEVSYYVYSYALSFPYSDKFNAEPAIYDSSSKKLSPSNSTIGDIEISLSPGLQLIPSQITIVVEYNISNVVTNVLIPLQLKYSNNQTTSSKPVYYSSSPIIPTSSNINVNETNGSIKFLITFGDAVGCFSNVYSKNQTTFNVSAELYIIGANKINIPNGGKEFSCRPTQNVPINSSTISCSINTQQLAQNYPEIATLLNSSLGLPAYVLMNLSYNCYERREYNIPVIKT